MSKTLSKTLSERLSTVDENLTNLLDYANNTTGNADTDIGGAIRTLVDGFGSGGSNVTLLDYLTSELTGDLIVETDKIISARITTQSNLTSLQIKCKGFGNADSFVSGCKNMKTLRISSTHANTFFLSYIIGDNMNSLEDIYIYGSSVAFGRYFISYNNTSLKKVDIKASNDLSFGNSYQFSLAKNLKAIIFRYNKVVDGVLSTILPSTWETNPLYFYVPRDLVDSYKSNESWSAYANNIRAIEDYSVDGTIDGEIIIDY